MVELILHYLILFLIVGVFTIVYFALLRKSVDKIVSKQKSFNFIYYSFFVRILLAGVFFFLLLKYYKTVREIIFAVCVFVVCKYFILRKHRKGN